MLPEQFFGTVWAPVQTPAGLAHAKQRNAGHLSLALPCLLSLASCCASTVKDYPATCEPSLVPIGGWVNETPMFLVWRPYKTKMPLLKDSIIFCIHPSISPSIRLSVQPTLDSCVLNRQQWLCVHTFGECSTLQEVSWALCMCCKLISPSRQLCETGLHGLARERHWSDAIGRQQCFSVLASYFSLLQNK